MVLTDTPLQTKGSDDIMDVSALQAPVKLVSIPHTTAVHTPRLSLERGEAAALAAASGRFHAVSLRASSRRYSVSSVDLPEHPDPTRRV